MAWQDTLGRKKKKDEVIDTPSRYGSHASMVIGDLKDDWAVLRDNDGYYATTRDRFHRDPHPKMLDTRRSSLVERRVAALTVILLDNGFETLADFLASCAPEEEE